MGPESLRRAAIDRLGRRDERAKRVLESARISVEALGASDQKNASAVRVVVGTDAYSMGEIAVFPAIFDSLCECLAAGVAVESSASLAELRVRWAIVTTWADYRTIGVRDADPFDAGELREAIASYCEGAGDGETAEKAR